VITCPGKEKDKKREEDIEEATREGKKAKEGQNKRRSYRCLFY